MSPLSEYNELPWASLTFTPPSITPSLHLLSLNLALLTPRFPPHVYLPWGMAKRKGESAACTHVYLYTGERIWKGRKSGGGSGTSRCVFDFHVWVPINGLVRLPGTKRQREQQRVSVGSVASHLGWGWRLISPGATWSCGGSGVRRCPLLLPACMWAYPSCSSTQVLYLLQLIISLHTQQEFSFISRINMIKDWFWHESGHRNRF